MLYLITLAVFQLTVDLDWIVLLRAGEAWTPSDMIRIHGETRVTIPRSVETATCSEGFKKIGQVIRAYVILPRGIRAVQEIFECSRLRN